MILSCPGSGDFKQPSPEITKCPHCSAELEIWSDEIQATCPGCKKKVLRQEEKPTCLDWCKQARECVGEEVYSRYSLNKSAILKNKLIRKLEEYFGADAKRINHAKKVLSYAEELLKHEKADWHIVIPASILHDVGIKAAEKKYGSSAGHYQEKEGPDIARGILAKAGMKKNDIEEIAEIIAHHHTPGVINTTNFSVLYDADWLVNLKDEVAPTDTGKLRQIINKVFLTKKGKELAEQIYLKKEEDDVL